MDVMIGASSSDIRLRDKLNAGFAIVKTTYETDPNILTSISAVEADVEDNVIYSIDGLKLPLESIEDAAPGMYIVNGHKVVK